MNVTIKIKILENILKHCLKINKLNEERKRKKERKKR